MPLASPADAQRGTESNAVALRRVPLTILAGDLGPGQGQVHVQQLESCAKLISYEAPVEYRYGDPGAEAFFDGASGGHVLCVSTTQQAAVDAFQRLLAADGSGVLDLASR